MENHTPRPSPSVVKLNVQQGKLKYRIIKEKKGGREKKLNKILSYYLCVLIYLFLCSNTI